MDSQDLARIIFAFKRQLAVDSPASGVNAFGIELLPSQGLQAQAATIASGMMKRNRMKKRPRRGSVKSTAGYETEIVKGVFEGLGPAVLGAEDWTDEQTFDQTDLTSVTITGGGTILTFAGGNLITLGFVAGQFIQLHNVSVAGNNDIWVPVVSVGGLNNRVLTVPEGYLADNALDNAFFITIARHVFTPETYVDSVYSAEEYAETIDRSKFVQNARFNSLVIAESPSAYSKLSFGLAARALEMKAVEDSPVFDDPDFPVGESLILLDGGVFLNGERRVDFTGLTFGITAPVSTTDVIGTLDGPPAKIGDFEFAGSVTGVVYNGDDFDNFEDDVNLSLIAHYKDKEDESGVGIYVGNLSFGGYGSPASGAGDQLHTMQLYGGDDDRGAGYAQTILLISDLAASVSVTS